MTPPYQLTSHQVFAALSASPTGLSRAEAAERLRVHGPNVLDQGKRPSLLRVFLDQFRDLMVVILLAAALVSLLSGNGESTLVIFAVLVLNAALGTVEHRRAERSLAGLKALSAPAAKVLRDGVRTVLPAGEVVPGDLLELEAGDLVAADARVVESFSLKVNESSLTGESEGVEKMGEALPAGEIPLGDRKNMVFSGSLVVYGRATAVVTATGMDTELGRVAALMEGAQARATPLQRSLDAFGRKLAVWVLAVCAVVFGLSLLHGQPVLDALLFAVALAVAAIPEALGSIITIVQAVGTQKMAKQHAVIKNLSAVETLGCVSVICSDKTGTLTQNRMTPRELYAGGRLFPAEELRLDFEPCRVLLRAALLASDATTDDQAVGDPTEVALVMLGDRLGVEESQYRAQHPRLGELAFDSDRKLMSTLHSIEGTPTLYTKGALDVLLPRCVQVLTEDGPRPMTERVREEITAQSAQWSDRGLRVLAFALRELEAVRPLTAADEDGYTFLGLVSMVDPPRPEAIQAVAQAARGGVRTVMITGDHKATAAAIARELGILRPGEEALSGPELDGLSDAELARRLEQVSVYARVSPEHKIRIVKAWQDKGRVAAMTGDGVNDAPALKAADIGVAMGITGTEVSKDAADMILTDDNFSTIVGAVVNGRSVYANIKNAVYFLLSGNMAGILCVFLTSLLGLPMPFAPVQLLFINLVTDSLPAITIGMEPAGSDLLDRPPRDPGEPILDRRLTNRVLRSGALIAAATLGAYFAGLGGGGAGEAMTLAFATLTLARLLHGFNCRGEGSLRRLGLGSNRASLAAFGVGVVLLAAVLFLPGLSRLFQIIPPAPRRLALAAVLAALPTLVIQSFRLFREGKGQFTDYS